jgi:hypothetical protein
MEIQELNKKQLVLLTLLVTFVVSIATGIVTVSLMQKAPKNVPQLVNNVIERTIEKVTLQETTNTEQNQGTVSSASNTFFSGGDVQVSIYPKQNPNIIPATNEEVKELGKGIILSDVGLILVDSMILNNSDVYVVSLNKKDFDATLVQKFNNGFSVLKITTTKSEVKTENPNTQEPVAPKTQVTETTPKQ